MKNLILSAIVLLISFLAIQAQEMTSKVGDSKRVKLEQTPGEFTQQTLKLKPGSYIFEVTNKGIDHAVGFVLAPKSDPDAHIQSAYVTKAIAKGATERSNTTVLTKGEYVYFCPLNPTPQYKLIVE
ncbi:hypothetical protein [Aureitalea marina]|uniref:EfeO-type cupredoxin-like domain-containing protein n=1 Tax=Aureitalea marina TaxID=930804 RepID=A0A2S7KRU9_9FLAO|nr:hypothetical protein [Aureitalea marina]PQB05283.1 hypothetical protein BST85_10610 [Aureitalea marina]